MSDASKNDAIIKLTIALTGISIATVALDEIDAMADATATGEKLHEIIRVAKERISMLLKANEIA